MPSEEFLEFIQDFRVNPAIEHFRMKPFPIQASREAFDAFPEFLPCPSDVKVETVDEQNVSAEWILAPGAADDRAILYLHGGCYITGSANSHREFCARISAATGGAVLLLNYRRAPEYPCPAAVEDTVAAFHWLRKRGISASRIIIAGESAGGALTLSAMTMLRDARQELPAGGIILSPWVDLDCTGKDPEIPDQIFTRADLRYLACYYLGSASPQDPLASPLFADLRGLPPIYIQVGSAEVLLDDSHRLFEKAQKDGVDIKLDVWEGLCHAFQMFPFLPEASEAVERMAGFIDERLR